MAFKVVQMTFLAMQITKKSKFVYIYSGKFTKYLHGAWSLLNMLMIFGIKEIYNVDAYIVGYCYKYTRAT